jgi:hypothetical protein
MFLKRGGKMKEKRESIKVPTVVITIIVTLLISFFVGLMLIPYKQPYIVRFGTEVKQTEIDVIPNRGGIFINDTLVINSSAELISENPDCSRIWRSHGPIIDFDTIPHQYTLGDMSIPYELSKNENCDTIIIKKDGYELKFLLIEE